MYKKINQITVNDEKLNVYAIFNGHSQSYLYDLFIVDDKDLKRLFQKEVIKATLVALSIMTSLTLIVASIIHAFNSDVMLTNSLLTLRYTFLWVTSVVTLPVTIPIVLRCLQSFLSFLKEETFVNSIEPNSRIGGRRIRIFSYVNDYRNRSNDNREKAFSFVEYLKSLKVSELEEIFYNNFKMRELQKDNVKIESLLNDNQYIDGFKEDLQNQLHKNDEKINFYRDYQNQQEEKIKEFYEKPIKEEILDLLAS